MKQLPSPIRPRPGWAPWIVPATATLALLATPRLAPAADPAGPRTTSAAPEELNPEWWRAFDDPALADLVNQASVDNPSMRVAAGRIAQAKALARQSLAPLLPSASFDASLNASPYESLGFQFGGLPRTGPSDEEPPEVFYSGSATVNVGIEPDIWGRNYLGYRASRREVDASRSDRGAQQLALATRIVTTYYDLRTADVRVELLQRQLERNQTFLQLVEQRYELGQSSAVEVLQQRQLVAASVAQLPQQRILQRNSRLQMAVLLGQPAGTDLSLPSGELPELTPVAWSSVPDQLLSSRPDIQAAQLRHQASQSRVSSAVRGRLPSLRLSAQAGLQGNQITELNGQNTWGAAAALSWPIWQGGRIDAQARQAEAAASIARENHRQALLNAQLEVQSALETERQQRARLDAVEQQAEAARLAHEEAVARYLAGLDSYLFVLTALASDQQAELTVLQARRDVIAARIQVYSALGGSWRQAQGDPS